MEHEGRESRLSRPVLELAGRPPALDDLPENVIQRDAPRLAALRRGDPDLPVGPINVLPPKPDNLSSPPSGPVGKPGNVGKSFLKALASRLEIVRSRGNLKGEHRSLQDKKNSSHG